MLVWKAATRTMNPRVPQATIDAAYERDPITANAEYGAEFRSDLEAFVSTEVIESIVEHGCHELPYSPARHYVGFADAAGGSGQDSFAWAIAHLEAGVAVLDLIREVKPPFSPAGVVERAAAEFRAYKIAKVKADKWGSAFVTEAFAKQPGGPVCEQNAAPKSEIYGEFLPLANSCKVRLLDNQRLISQLTSLERRTARGGRDSIDHPPKQHDDIANAACGALVAAATTQTAIIPTGTAAAVLARLRGQTTVPGRRAYGSLDGPRCWNVPQPQTQPAEPDVVTAEVIKER